jgi:hypothetical protein
MSNLLLAFSFFTIIPALNKHFNIPAINPATAARQGSRVAASRVDSCEFGTADERG